MARDDRQNRQQRRALDDLEKGLKRSDVELACSGLLALPKEARTASVAPVGRLLRQAARAHFRRQEWSRLRGLAVSVRQEPALLTLDVGEEELEETAWALFWGMVREGRLEESAGFYDVFSQRIPAPLAEALAALLAGASTIPPALLAALGISDGDDAQRLGNEPTSAAPRLPSPTGASEARAALFALAALRPWAALAAAVRSWLPVVPPESKSEVVQVAADLALRELLIRADAGEARLFEPAALLGELVALDADGLAQHGIVGLRVLASSLHDEIADRSAAQALLSLAVALARSLAGRDLAASVVAQAQFHDQVGPIVLPGLEALLAAAPSVPLWIASARLWRSRNVPGTEPPAWLARSLASLLDDGSFGRVVATTGGSAGTKARMRTLELVADAMPMALAERALDQAWQRADDEVRPHLAHAFHLLLERARLEATSPPGGWTSLAQRDVFREMRDQLERDPEPEELMEIVADAKHRGLTPKQVSELIELLNEHRDGHLPASVGPLWARWRDRMVPCHPRFLELALAGVTSAQSAIELATTYLAKRPDVDAWLEALTVLGEAEPDFGDAFVPVVLDKFEGDVAALARAVLLSVRFPRAARVPIADAFLGAYVLGSVRFTDDISRALDLAQELRRTSRPKSKAAKVTKLKVTKLKVEKAKVEKAKVEKPKVEKPKVEKPKVEKPKVEKPKVEKPKPGRARASGKNVDPTRGDPSARPSSEDLP